MWGGFTFVGVGMLVELRKTLPTCVIDCIRMFDDWVCLLHTLSNGICESDLTPTAIEINTWSKCFSNRQACLSSQKKNMGPGTNALYAANHTVKWASDESSKIKCSSQMAWEAKVPIGNCNIYKISCENWTLHQMNGPSLPQPNRFHWRQLRFSVAFMDGS